MYVTTYAAIDLNSCTYKTDIYCHITKLQSINSDYIQITMIVITEFEAKLRTNVNYTD